MCITIDEACGFVFLNNNTLDTFVYCCKQCSNEFALAQDFEEHVLSKHYYRDIDDDADVCDGIFATEYTSNSMQIEAENIKIEEYDGNEHQPNDSVNHDFYNDINHNGDTESVNINRSFTHQDQLPENSEDYLLEIKSDELANEINITNAIVTKRKLGRPMGWTKQKHGRRSMVKRKEKITLEYTIPKDESNECLAGIETTENSGENPAEILNDPTVVEIKLTGVTGKRQRTQSMDRKKKQINNRNVTMSQNSVISFQCYMCPGKSFTKTGLKIHMHRHTHPMRSRGWKMRMGINCSALATFSENSNIFYCEMCPVRIFRSKGGLRAHMTTTHIRRLNSKKCDICNKIPFSYEKHMRKHMIRYKCDYCEKIYKYKRGKVDHMRKHTGEIKVNKC